MPAAADVHCALCKHMPMLARLTLPPPSQYRTSTNYRDGAWLGPRVGDKLIFSLLIMSLYWGIGDDFSQNNVINIVAILFMWCTLPAFGAASYVPSLVLERPLFVR